MTQEHQKERDDLMTVNKKIVQDANELLRQFRQSPDSVVTRPRSLHQDGPMILPREGCRYED